MRTDPDTNPLQRTVETDPIVTARLMMVNYHRDRPLSWSAELFDPHDLDDQGNPIPLRQLGLYRSAHEVFQVATTAIEELSVELATPMSAMHALDGNFRAWMAAATHEGFTDFDLPFGR